MIPILFEAQTKDFRSNGIGRLSDCISFQVTEERNGSYEVVFKYPVTGLHFDEIIDDRIVYTTHDNTGDKQPFLIYAKSAPINGIVTFNAHHISYGLTDVIVKPFTASSVSSTLNKLRTAAMTDQPFSFWTDKTTVANFKSKIPASARSLLGGTEGSILDVFGGGEYEFDHYLVKLHDDRGADNGVTVRYGKNLTSFVQTHSVLNSYNTIIPYWTDIEGNVVYGNPVVAIGSGTKKYTNTWTEENDTVITDENGNSLEFDYYLNHAVTMNFTDRFVDAPTKAQLQEVAASYLASNTPWLPLDNLKFNFVDLFGAGEIRVDKSGYLTDENDNYILDENNERIMTVQNFAITDIPSLTNVKLCDTVTLIYTALGVSTKAKVIKTVWNPLLDRYDSLEMGNARPTLSQVINKGTRVLLADYSTTTEMESAIDHATSLITGGMGGHVVFAYDAEGKPTEIFVMDTEDVNTATNVLRINVNGIGFSHNGLAGPFETAWTLDGHFVANFIDTGTLSANLIRAGVLASNDGSSYWDLDGSDLRFYDKRFDSFVELDEGYIKFGHGEETFGKLIRRLTGDGDDVFAIIGGPDDNAIITLRDFIHAFADGEITISTKTYYRMFANDSWQIYVGSNNNDYIRIYNDGTYEYIDIHTDGYYYAKAKDSVQFYSGTGDRSKIRMYDDGTFKFIDLNSDGEYIRIDGKDNYIRLQTSRLNINGHDGYNGNVTVDGKTLTFTKGILTGVS